MSNLHRGILVFSEARETCLELLGKAHEVAARLGMPVTVALLGERVAAEAVDLGTWGADQVYTVENPRLERFDAHPYTDALTGLIDQVKPKLILFGATKRGFELAPRVAARLGAACVSACVDFDIAPGTHEIEARAMIYTGLGIAKYRVKKSIAVLIVPPKVFVKRALNDRKAEIVPYKPKLGEPKLEILEVRPQMAAGTRLEDARVVVDVGQGFRQKEDLAIAQELADLLGGQVSCTRPISSERGWLPEWLGLSGRKVSPRLCITLGVAGAIQHMVGIRGSEVIVAVDNSPDSAMLVQADYGIIDDLYKFVPALMQVLKTRQLRAA